MLRQRGVSLPTLLMGVTTASIIAITIVSTLVNSSHIESLEGVAMKVKRLHTAVELFYDARCQAGPVIAPTIEHLVELGHLRSLESVSLPAGLSFSNIAIVDSGTPLAQFLYTVKFATDADAEVAAGNDFNVTVTDNLAIWNISSATNSDTHSTESHEYLRAFGGSSC